MTCKTCGDSIPPDILECTNCWEVEQRLDSYLRSPKGLEFAQKCINEQHALALGNDPERLHKLLQRSRDQLAKEAWGTGFGEGVYDFEAKTLTGENGMILQWKLRPFPGPISEHNGQTKEGCVLVTKIRVDTDD